MARAKSRNPRRERMVFYLTAEEKKTLDTYLKKFYPNLESASDRMRELFLQCIDHMGRGIHLRNTVSPDPPPEVLEPDIREGRNRGQGS